MKWNVLGLRWHANVEELDGNVFELVERGVVVRQLFVFRVIILCLLILLNVAVSVKSAFICEKLGELIDRALEFD